MSKRAFVWVMGFLGIMAMMIVIVGACASRKSEEEVKEIDTFIESIETREVVTDRTTETTTEETTTEEMEVPQTTASAEELADMVLTRGLNGDDRKAELGDRYEEVQRWIDENYEAPTYETYEYPSGGVLNPTDGINYFNGILETFYCLPMDGVVNWMHDLGYEGDYWVRSDGVKMFGDYVMVAADYGQFPKGTIVETSLGTGIVCDTGLGGFNWFDIATNWAE